MNKTLLRRICLLAAAAVAVVSSSLPARADYPSTVQADSPVAYYRLGEMPLTYDDPTIVTNLGSLASSADGVFGGYVLRGVPGALTGTTDTAFEFKSSEGSRVTMSNNPAFNFTGTTSFTLECWAKPTATLSGSQRLIANGSSGQGYAFCFQGTSQLRITGFGVADVTSDTAPVAFAVGQWYHLALVRSNAYVYFYTNGVQFGGVKSLSNIKTTANPLTLGRTAAGSEPFTGDIDEAAVYTNVLTAAQISAHFAKGTTDGPGYPGAILADGPIGYWRLNEPKKTESSSVIVNSGSLGPVGNGSVYGSLNSVTGGVTGVILGDANTAMGFNGVNGRVDVPYAPGLNPTSFTVEAWARLDAWNNSHQSPISSRNYTAATGWTGYMFYAAPSTGNAPRWEFWTGPGFNAIAAPAPDVVMGQWAHLVGTYDAATGTKVFYVDGQAVGGGVGVTMNRNDGAPARLAAGATETVAGNYYWNGALDEVAVYPSALAPDRIQAHFEAAKGTPPAVTAAAGIAVNPLSVTNWAPYPVTISGVVTGSLPMQLQWYRVSADLTTRTPVANATNMAVTISPTAASDSGNYVLTATNALGGGESLPAWVEIIPLAAPSYTVDAPPLVPVYDGGTAGIPVEAAGTPTITYQWSSNSVAIAGATHAILTVPNSQAALQTVSYQATASSVAGTTPSSIAKLQVLTAPPTTYAAVTKASNPYAYLRLGEDTGNVAFDYWGGKPGLYVNAYPSATGALTDDDDGCVQLYGAGSHVTLFNPEKFNFTTTNVFTLVSWIRADNWTPNPDYGVRFFSNRKLVGGTGGYGLSIVNNNVLRFTAFGRTDVNSSAATFQLNTWYHIAAVYSNTTVRLYIDGAFNNSGTVTALDPSPYPLQLGGSPNFSDPRDEEAFTGQLDEAAVYNRALSSDEIAALYVARYGSLQPPFFIQSPGPCNIYVGGTARFSAQASGSAPLSYQWKTNGTAIPNATNATLVVPGVTAAMSGINFSVTIANKAGQLTSGNALLTVLTPYGYEAAVAADNPVALYRLGESSGPAVYDTWGGHNGSDSGTVVYGTPGAILGDANTAATFDGASSKVEVPFSSDLNPPVFTAECWARVTGKAGSYRAVMSARDEVLGGNQKGFIIYATAGNNWEFWSGGPGWQSLSGGPVVEGEWTHLVAVYDGANKYFYVNGELKGVDPQTIVPNNIRSFRIGNGKNEDDPGDYYFYGDIDEVAVYNTVLTPERIAAHYGLGKYSTTTAPIVVREPVSQTVVEGNPVSLAVQAVGSPVLAYQWYKGADAIAAATTRTLDIAKVSFSDAATYSVKVSNDVGSTNVSATLTVAPVPTFANLTNDLVMHLRFDGDYLDVSGRGNSGTPIGTPSFVAGKIGSQALRYNTDAATSTYNYVTLGTPPDLQFSSNVNFSVAFWLKYSASPGDPVFIGTMNWIGGSRGWLISPTYGTGGLVTYLWGTGGEVYFETAEHTIDGNNWHHVVLSVNRTGYVDTYLDGVRVDRQWATGLGDINNADLAYVLNIGQDGTGTYSPSIPDGTIDDVGIWLRALSEAEALGIYNAGQEFGQSFDVYGPVTLTARPAGTDLELVWQAGTLMQSSEINGIYTAVPGATAPYFKVTPGAGKMFYRVKL